MCALTELAPAYILVTNRVLVHLYTFGSNPRQQMRPRSSTALLKVFSWTLDIIGRIQRGISVKNLPFFGKGVSKRSSHKAKEHFSCENKGIVLRTFTV